MSDQFPMFKLGTLMANQVSSPLATRIREFAMKHPLFSRRVCGRLAWIYRYGEAHCRMMALRLAGHTSFASSRRIHVPDVSPDEARELGAKLLGELIVFALASSILIFELNRQATIKATKTRQRKENWWALQQTLEQLKKEVERQNIQLAEAKQRLSILREEKEHPKDKNKSPDHK